MHAGRGAIITWASSALSASAAAATASALSRKCARVTVSFVRAPGLKPSRAKAWAQWASSQPAPRMQVLRCGRQRLGEGFGAARWVEVKCSATVGVQKVRNDAEGLHPVSVLPAGAVHAGHKVRQAAPGRGVRRCNKTNRAVELTRSTGYSR